MWDFIADNKEIFAVVAAVVTGVFGVVAALLSRRRIIIHQIVTIPADPPAPTPGQAPPGLPAGTQTSEVSSDRPRIELVSAYPAVRTDARTTLDVLVRILPPTRIARDRRPPVNLALVLDRSGSMAAHNKLGFAREAAIYAVEQLLPTDRVSVTVFDDKVETVVPSTPASDKTRISGLIRQVKPGGTTALHAAWQEGCRQAGLHPVAEGINRVLLLSDGLANVGETNPDVIASDVKKASQGGVSSTSMGVGQDYNEDMLEAIAKSGDGNYYYIASPQQLPDIFQTELLGLLATAGTRVSLGIEPQHGVTVADVLNDLDRTELGRLKLANLIAGMPIEVVVRLSVPPLAEPAEVCRFRVAWDAPGQKGRQAEFVALTLPVKPSADWDDLAGSPEVRERAVLLLLARLKKQATGHIEKGDRAAAERCLSAARELLGTIPRSPLGEQESEAITRIEGNLARGELGQFAKEAKYQHYWRTMSRPQQ
jgi:Ca-activated chloride channel family protein